MSGFADHPALGAELKRGPGRPPKVAVPYGDIELRIDACNVYSEFLATQPDMQRERISTEQFLREAEKIRAYLERGANNG